MGETELGDTKLGGNYPANVELALAKVSSHCKATKLPVTCFLPFIVYMAKGWGKRFWGKQSWGTQRLGKQRMGETITI